MSGRASAVQIAAAHPQHDHAVLVGHLTAEHHGAATRVAEGLDDVLDGVGDGQAVAGANRRKPAQLFHTRGTLAAGVLDQPVDELPHVQRAGVPPAGDQDLERRVAGDDQIDVEGLRVIARGELDDLLLGHLDGSEFDHRTDDEVLEVDGHDDLASTQIHRETDVARAVAGDGRQVITTSTIWVNSRGESGYFSHGGWDEGFCTQLTAHLDGGYGVVVMINSNHPDFLNEVVNAVGHTYGWDRYEAHEILPVPKKMLNEYTGRYHYNAAIPVIVTSKQGKLFLNYPGAEVAELIYTGDDLFMRRNRTAPIKFTSDDKAIQFNFVLGDDEYQAHRQLADDEYLPGEILDTGAYADALAAFRAALKESPDEETLSENYLNGYALNSLADSQALSTKLLQISTDLYPDSANTWDSLALAYRQAGNKEKAIEHYRNALKRDPKFASALSALAELENTEKE